jgi:hypothetical protein
VPFSKSGRCGGANKGENDERGDSPNRRRALVAAPSSHADPAYDQKFIDHLDMKGVPYKNRTEIIRVAHELHPDGHPVVPPPTLG